ncbi:hypothetical protein DYBT9623_00439 [Dyadobacter sp. CECT 9623]|uniref:PhnB-like domain-containing protein n=2 Tax=Spirosomataceae TaxID=2896860 RepID=A0ABM8UJN6_9BACT|nr:hypothetical protein DYBT9623_00439 [Dyadobacter sp. CECT 9623]
MFEGRAEEAINLYISLFENSSIDSLVRRGPGDFEGKILHAAFTLNGQSYMASDSDIKHDFTFTPSTSFFVNCESEEEIDRLYAELSKDGGVLMPLDNYGFGKKFAWINDRFGVSWQISLP